jgi:hypothetical protein
VRDQAPGAPDLELELALELELELDAAELTVAELIRGRVTMELARAAADPGYRPLVEQSADELLLNGPRPDRAAPSPDVAVVRALEAFARGRFMVLVDGRQASSAGEVLRLEPDSQVVFLRLLPLRGG